MPFYELSIAKEGRVLLSRTPFFPHLVSAYGLLAI
jgi:hypothetical protein